MYHFLFLAFLFPGDAWVFNTEDLPDYVFEISDLVVTPSGETYFLDRYESRVYHLNEMGNLVGHFGKKGQGPGEIQGAFRLQYLPANQTVYVFDTNRKRLISFKADLFVVEHQAPAKIFYGEPILIDARRIVYKKKDGGERKSKQGASLYLLDLDSGKETLLLQLDHRQHGDASRVERPGAQVYNYLDWTPRAVFAVDPGKRLYLGSTASFDLSIYNTSTVEKIGWLSDPTLKPRLLSDNEVEAFEEKTGWRILTAHGSASPSFRASLIGFFVDAVGRVWVQVNPPPGIEEQRYRIYQPSGKLVGKLSLPAKSKLKLYHADQHFLWLVATQEEEREPSILIKKQAYGLN